VHNLILVIDLCSSLLQPSIADVPWHPNHKLLLRIGGQRNEREASLQPRRFRSRSERSR